MKNKFKVLQGTDGVRARVIHSSDRKARGMSPLEAFLHKGVLTEYFFQLYTYTKVCSLIESGIIKEGDPVVIGWDPRDKEGLFTEYAVQGILKAGACALVTGIVPTPLVPLFMVYKNAKCGFMITASHNPSDQNGIKTFLLPHGIKMLPEDDEALSAKLFVQNYKTVMTMPVRGKKIDQSEASINLFEEFMLDHDNNWTDDKYNLSCYVIIIDPANGSYSNMAGRIFKRLGVKEIHEVNNNLDTGRVNKFCGVVDLENEDIITSSMIECPDGKFFRHDAVKKVFELGRKYKDSILSKKIYVAGCVFDADGDRFYRLDYNPLSDTVLVLDGDKTAFLQAVYLRLKNKNAYSETLYINTVESDLGAKCGAASLGFDTKLTAVGDKWILWWTALSFARRISDLIYARAVNDDETAFSEMLVKNIKEAERLSTGRIEKIREFYSLLEKECTAESPIKDIIIASFEAILTDEKLNFAVGSENSGHTITTGFITTEQGKRVPFFAGNGLKSAVNTLVATAKPFQRMDCDSYFSMLKDPFPTGFKKTFSLYYTKRHMVKKGGSFINGFVERVEDEVRRNLPNLKVEEISFTDEPDLIYLALIGGSGLTAAVYLRNSGTENKTGITVMGDNTIASELLGVGLSLYRYLLPLLKDRDNPMAKLELSVLSLLSDRCVLSHEELKIKLKEGYTLEYLLPTMINKEMLVQSYGGGYRITDLGKHYIDSI